MKKYKLSNTSLQFRSFLENEDVQHEITEDHKYLYVWCNCDQDLFDLGKLFERHYINLTR